MTFDLRAYSQGWQEHGEEWCAGRLVPSPASYFMTLIGQDSIDAFARRLGLTAGELAEQLDTGTVSAEHWPAILKAEKGALHHLEEGIRVREAMERSGLSVVETDVDQF